MSGVLRRGNINLPGTGPNLGANTGQQIQRRADRQDICTFNWALALLPSSSTNPSPVATSQEQPILQPMSIIPTTDHQPALPGTQFAEVAFATWNATQHGQLKPATKPVIHVLPCNLRAAEYDFGSSGTSYE